MSLATQIATFATRVGTEFKSIRTLIGGSGTSDISALTTTNKTSLVAAVNEVKAAVGAGSATNLDDLTDVVISSPATGHVLRHNGTAFVNTLGTTYFETAGAASAAQAAAIAASQPVDSDLTSIAALSTTSYGRAFLALANQAALMALVAPTSETAQGIVELATTAEANAGSDTARAVTPAGVSSFFTGHIDSNVALGTSNTVAPTQGAVKAYADALIGANDAMVFKGVVDASANPNYPASNRGDTYRISVAGKIGGASGVAVEVGDMLIALTDGTASGTQAAVGAQWNIVQGNLDGAVVGPVSAVSTDFATFSGTSGKVIQDSGLSLDTTTTLGTSNTKIPSQNAVKVYADTKQTLDADLTAIAALTSAADKLPYATGPGTWALTSFTSAGRALVDDADATAQRATLSVYSTTEIGDPTTDFSATFVAALA